MFEDSSGVLACFKEVLIQSVVYKLFDEGIELDCEITVTHVIGVVDQECVPVVLS